MLSEADRSKAADILMAAAQTRHWRPDNKARHEIYVTALEATGVTCVLGHFKSKDRKCNACGATWTALEEKETDVSIGISLVNDACKQRYEKADLVTRDSDLMPAVRMVQTEFRQSRSLGATRMI